ncbi:MAG: Ldh family oxidoreductase, partial [Rhizobiaceae bacterium]
PLLIDQSSSATAFVNVRAAASAGQVLPQGWAIDRDGKPTTDPKAAMEGALLAFGGARGANVALMVEVLSAGLSGANWSLDAPSILSGDQSPGTGLFIIAIDPEALAPGFSKRLAEQIARLDGYGVHIPGRTKAASAEKAARLGVSPDAALVRRLQRNAGAMDPI